MPHPISTIVLPIRPDSDCGEIPQHVIDSYRAEMTLKAREDDAFIGRLMDDYDCDDSELRALFFSLLEATQHDPSVFMAARCQHEIAQYLAQLIDRRVDDDIADPGNFEFIYE